MPASKMLQSPRSFNSHISPHKLIPMQSSAKTVAGYLKELPDESGKALTKLRTLIRKIAPDAAESMEHGLPCYELNGMICAFASQKQNLALYVCNTALVAQFKPRLGKVSCGKSCIRFKSLDDLRMDAVADLLRASVEQARAKANPNDAGH
jgi:uncharacterized protein YdhG (YjbR/CyaY superfamily)